MTEYYTVEEAMNILKKTKTVFYQLVNKGEIPYEIDSGRKRGKKFPKSAIDILAKINDKDALPTFAKEPLSLAPSTIAELWQGMEITRTLYGDDDEVSFERLLEWRSVNPDIFMSLKEGNSLIGSITFLPVEERIANALINGQMLEKDILPSQVRRWTQTSLSIYVPTIEVLPSKDFHRDRERGMFLLRHTIKWAVLMSIQHDVKSWYAIGATQDGRNILRTLGFKKATILDNEREGYRLETKQQPVKLIGMYLKEITEKSA